MPLSKGGGGIQSSTMFFILNRNGIPDLFLEAATSDTHRQDTGWFLIASRINCKRYWLPLVHLIASRWGSLSTPCSETWKSRLHKKCPDSSWFESALERSLAHVKCLLEVLKSFQVPAQSLSSPCSKPLKCLLEALS